MEIRDAGQVRQSDVSRPPAAPPAEQQAAVSVTDSFQKGAAAPKAPVDLKKAAGVLLRTARKGPVEVKWTKEMQVMGSPVLGANGTLFVSERYPEKSLHAFDPVTGMELWKQKYGNGDNGPSAPSIAPDGSLLVAGDDGKLHNVDPATGKDNWSMTVNIGSGITVYDDDRISFRSGGSMVCLDLKSRKIVSKTPLTGNFESTPVVARDGTVYGGGHDGRLYALEGGTGREKWNYDTGGMLRNSPTIGPDGTVYAGCIGNSLHAVDPATGQKKWSVDTGGYILESPVIGQDGTVFFGNNDNYVYSIDPATGKENWKFYCGGEIRVAPTPADDGLLYVVTDRNVVLGLDQASGGKAFEYHADSYIHCPPACDGKGNFFFGCNNTKLYAMNVPEVAERVKAEEESRNPEAAAAAESAHTVEKKETFVVVDGVKLDVKKQKDK